MAVDPYQPCPCGSGKKIKFCCADVAGELEKLQRMLAAEQYAACLDRVEQLQAKHPDRPALYSFQIAALAALGQREAMVRVADEFAQKCPGNPLALAEQAMLRGEDGQLTEAVGLLQDAVESGVEPLPSALLAAFGGVGGFLAVEGFIPAAVQHLATELISTDDPDAALGSQRLGQVMSAAQISPLLRQLFHLSGRDAECRPSLEHNQALAPVAKLLWRKAKDALTPVAEKSPQDPLVWRDLAILRGWLAEEASAAEAWRHVASLPVSQEEAVEAEALALLLSGEFMGETVELVKSAFALGAFDEVEARLAADSRFQSTPFDASAWNPDLGPPPRKLLLVLDRPLPATSPELTLEALPENLGEALLFPRQTDREARLEVVARRDKLALVLEEFRSVLGDLLGAAQSDEVIGSVGVFDDLIAQRPVFPPETAIDQHDDLTLAWLRRAVCERLPRIPLKLLGDRSLEQAAADPAARIKVLALLSQVRASLTNLAGHFDFDALIAQLGLPVADKTSVSEEQFDELPVSKYLNVDLAALDEKMLASVFKRSVVSGMPEVAIKAARRLAALDAGTLQAEAFGYLAQTEVSSKAALAALEQAQQAADRVGKSSAPYDIMELGLRARREDSARFLQVLQHIQTAHGREPGVAQQLGRLLMQLGILRPDGTAALPMAAEPEPAGLIVPGGASEAGGKLWTPGGDEPRREKSSLWVPGS
jgi:tetratricopeptide (TPR) repeat protein